MPTITKEVLLPNQTVRLKTLDRFTSLFGLTPRRLDDPIRIYLLISIKSGFGHCLVDNEYVPLAAGSLLLINPHAFLHLENTQYLLGSVIIFTDDFFCRASATENLLYKVAYHPEVKPYIKLGDEATQIHFMQTSVHMFASEYRMQKDKSESTNNFLLNLLHGLILIIHKNQLLQCGKRYDNQYPFQQHKLAEFVKLVNEHFKSHHSLDFYAEKMGMSIVALGRICKEAGNITGKELIMSKLIEEAKMLLIFDPRPLSDISFDLGFPEYAAFNSFIRQQLHTTPTELRSQSSFQ
jgi:AraC family transcriptional activator of pobA